LNKKQEQLGMNPSTASGRLVKDILFDRVVKHEKCYRCGGIMTRENFSIEHKEAWLDSEDPRTKFFDLSNVAFSHHSCNIKAGKKPKKLYFTAEEKIDAQRCYRREHYARLSVEERKKQRRKQYERTGK
jgi:hypothetical protein